MSCPQCDGPGLPLGALGTTVWFRCWNCGWQFSVKDEPEDDDETDAQLEQN